MHDRAALILIFGVPLFAFVGLTAVFSHPVIRGLGVAVVDADRSETSRAFIEQVAASPSLSIVERAGDLASAARAIRSGDAIAAVYIPADFERDLKAERRPQVVAFYNQQFLTAAGVASSGLSDSLSAAVSRAVDPRRPKASRIGSLVAETIVLVNPQRNYAQFLLRALLPMVIHVVITLAAGYAVGSEFRRRSMRAWLACAGGNPVVALAGKLAPLFVIFFFIMLAVPLFLEGCSAIVFKGDVPMIIVAGSLLIVGYLALGALLQLAGRRPRDRTGPHRPCCLAGVRLCGRRISGLRHECVLAGLGRDPAGAMVHGACCSGRRRAGCRCPNPRAPSRRWQRSPCSTPCLRFCACARVARSATRSAPAPAPAVRRRCAARRRRSFCRRVAARAGDPRRFHPAGGGAAGLRLLLPAALSQSDPAQDPDCGRRQRPERAQPQHRGDTGRERRGQRRGSRRNARRGARGGRPRRSLGCGRHPAANRARRAQRQLRSHSDLCRCHLPVHLQDDGERHRHRDRTLSSELAAGGARTDGSLVKATLASASPADVLLQPIFNPVGGYASYIVPAAFVLILQQMLLIGASMLTVIAHGAEPPAERSRPCSAAASPI